MLPPQLAAHAHPLTPRQSLKSFTRRTGILRHSIAKKYWPTDGSQHFILSFGDKTGYGNHANYAFRGNGDALQRVMNVGWSNDLFSNDIKCSTLKTQAIQEANGCTKKNMVKDDLEGWVTTLPGGVVVS